MLKGTSAVSLIDPESGVVGGQSGIFASCCTEKQLSFKGCLFVWCHALQNTQR